MRISDWSSDVCSSDLQGSLANGFTCTFHNWRFNLDGSLKGVTDPETFRPETLCRNLDLSAVRCESWEGFIFVNLNPDAGPLLDQLGPLPDHARPYRRSEEHTSELQSLMRISYAVFCLKKKKIKKVNSSRNNSTQQTSTSNHNKGTRT